MVVFPALPSPMFGFERRPESPRRCRRPSVSTVLCGRLWSVQPTATGVCEFLVAMTVSGTLFGCFP
jgi:hypothetical protein